MHAICCPHKPPRSAWILPTASPSLSAHANAWLTSHGALLVVNGGNGLHIWSVASGISNEQSQTADNGCCSSLRIGHVTQRDTEPELKLGLTVKEENLNWRDYLVDLSIDGNITMKWNLNSECGCEVNSTVSGQDPGFLWTRKWNLGSIKTAKNAFGKCEVLILVRPQSTLILS